MYCCSAAIDCIFYRATRTVDHSQISDSEKVLVRPLSPGYFENEFPNPFLPFAQNDLPCAIFIIMEHL